MENIAPRSLYAAAFGHHLSIQFSLIHRKHGTKPVVLGNRIRKKKSWSEENMKLDVHESVHRDTIIKVTNKMQLYSLICYS
jgi:hypothetical protein